MGLGDAEITSWLKYSSLQIGRGFSTLPPLNKFDDVIFGVVRGVGKGVGDEGLNVIDRL